MIWRDELEYQRDLTRRGQLEEKRMWENQLDGDVLGFDDGRPGIGVGMDLLNGPFLTMPFLWRIALWALVVLLLAAAALGTRACFGERESQRILHENEPAAGSQAGSG